MKYLRSATYFFLPVRSNLFLTISRLRDLCHDMKYKKGIRHLRQLLAHRGFAEPVMSTIIRGTNGLFNNYRTTTGFSHRAWAPEDEE